MHKGNAKSRWQRFCAAMVQHGHGRTSDISAASAQRRPSPKRKVKKPGPEKADRKLPFEMLSMIAV
jgi:hypothetical protein